MRYGKKLLLLISLSLTSVLLHAGSLKGKVTEAGSREPLAAVSIALEYKGKKIMTATDLEGNYRIDNLSPGEYNLQFSMTGFQHVERKISLGTDLTIFDVELTPRSIEMDRVTVSGSASKESETGARRTEKNADNILNIVPARTIQLSPDITVANVLQRVSGVSVERSSNGDAQYAIIRGMDKRYNYTLVNGIKISSPDYKNRYLPMDIFPAELLERLEVIKALTPDMEGDAIGGVMNLQMRTAPDEALFTVSAATGFDQLFADRSFSRYDRSDINSRSPRELHGGSYLATGRDFPLSNLVQHTNSFPVNQLYNVTAGKRFGPGRQLGILLAGTYQDTYRGANSEFFNPDGQPDPDPAPGNNPVFNDLQIRQYSVQQKRMAGYLKADYIFNKSNNISWTNMLLKLDEFQFRNTIDTVFAINSTGPGNRLTQRWARTRSQYQSIYNSTLQGNHALTDALKANWTFAYSHATNKIPDWAEYITQYQVSTDASGHTSSTPEDIQNVTRIWAHNSDRDLAGYASISYDKSIAKHPVKFTAGGMFRNKERNNFYITYQLVPTPGANPQYTGIQNAAFSFEQAGEGAGQYPNFNTYSATENVSGVYGQFKTDLTSRLEALAGSRWEHTYFKFNTAMPDNFAATFGTIEYADWLPSLHLKYALTPASNLRFSYFKSISRPGFYELLHFMPGDYYNEVGNFNVKHTRADNLDLRYEWFPKGAGQLLLGVFYKNLKDPIEYALEANGPSVSELKAENFGTATNYGAELVFIRYIRNFGINFNYTYTSSSITTTKALYYRDPVVGLTTVQVRQTRPLQNQSAHIGNLSLIYKGPRTGLDVQLAFVYTGPRIVFVSPYYDLDYWQKEVLQTDFSLEKKITRHFSVYAKINNLFNIPYTVEIHKSNPFVANHDIPDQTTANRILVQKDSYGRNYLAGLRYKL